MSVIQTIRNRYGKIAGGIIAFALVGFIISDARNGSFGNFLGGHDSNVMKIDGVKIDPKEYQQRLKEYETLSLLFNGGHQMDDAQKAQMNENVIESIVNEKAIEIQCDKLGIITTEDDKKEMIYGQNANPTIRQFALEGNQIFLNPDTHQFDPGRVKEWEKELADATTSQKIDPTGKYKEQWQTVKNYVLRMDRINKYNAMFVYAVYAPVYVAKYVAEESRAMASIKYVKIPFTAIPDNDVKVSDDDLKAFMQKHAGFFTTDQPTRGIEYVSFEINPSSADTARSLNAVADIKNDFVAAKDNKSFVNSKSEEANTYSEAYLNKKTFLSRFADTIMEQPEGSVYGPYYENGSYKITKVVSKKTLPDSVKSRHILVITKAQGNEVATDTAAKMKLDSAIAAIKGGGKFDSIVQVYGVDDGSKAKGGEITLPLIQRGAMPKEFGDFVFEGKTGESKVIKVTNDNFSGYYYVEIESQTGTGPAIQIATVAKSLAPSDSTVNAIYGQANEFAGKNTTAESFEATIKKQNLDKRIADNIKVNAFSITGIGPSREVVRWIYDHDRKIGDISAVFQIGEQRYVVAQLISMQEKGMAALSPANRSQIEQKVREEKKADMISKKYTGSLDAIASAAGQQVQQVDSVRLGGSYIPNLGFEPKVAGYAFNAAFQPNTVSPGIDGTAGVYFITVLSRANDPLPADQNILFQILNEQRRADEMQTMKASMQILQQTIDRKTEVTYNAANF